MVQPSTVDGTGSSSVEQKVGPSFSNSPGTTLQYEIGKSPYLFENDYVLETKFRSGSYGVVYTTKHKKSHEEYAVKVIDRTKLKEKDDKEKYEKKKKCGLGFFCG